MKGTMEEERYKMRAPCLCGCEHGVIRTVGYQDTVRCLECGAFQYNAPRKETGRPQLHVAKREKLAPSLRAHILIRGGGACELCHQSHVPLVVGHLLSLDAGRAEGLSDDELNNEENLAAMCDACNSGLGKQPVPLRVMVAIIIARSKLLNRKLDLNNVGVKYG